MKGIVAMTAVLLVALVLTSLLAFGLDRQASLEADQNDAAGAAGLTEALPGTIASSVRRER
ncbi:MAG: hypothetical protein J0J01_23195 [Reyranella sp.]|uniref:hypothetical protein n=1 Tax=Reyranella sp. TaxID=1929291 RepID=UPI001AD41CBC|nr:hypothetical protein [Reyranella sp.]MBN9089829.1 hypothetical protein [Reyranella sp.]